MFSLRATCLKYCRVYAKGSQQLKDNIIRSTSKNWAQMVDGSNWRRIIILTSSLTKLLEAIKNSSANVNVR